MKNAIAASALLSLAAAQGPPGGWHHGGPGGGFGPFASFPSCATSCWQNVQGKCSSMTDYSCLCGSSVIDSANSCIESSSCSDSEKDQVYKAVDQLCANVGATVTASPEATWSATSGGNNWPGSWTTSNWPSNAPWAGGPGGWNGRPPFGPNGWGSWGSSGAWTKGPWTSWWGNGACPPSTWSGWTNGPWASQWTSWTGCTASTTATSVLTTTGSSGATVTTTVYGLNLAEATNGGSSGSSSSSQGAAPRQTGNAMLGASAAGALGVLAGALML